MNPDKRPDPTQDELDFLLDFGMIWISGDKPNQWLFERDGIKYDLSAADLLAIDRIIENGHFIYNPLQAV